MAEILDDAALPAAELAELQVELAPIRTLEELVRWGLRKSPPRDIAGVVTQDEYTHDVLIRWRDTIYLVFDAT